MTEVTAVLSTDPAIRQAVASTVDGRLYAAHDLGELVSLIGLTRAKAVVIDSDVPEAATALERVAQLPTRGQLLVIWLVRGPAPRSPRGADLVVTEPALADALLLANLGARIHGRPVQLDKLLGVSLLGGPLDEALDHAAARLAEGFGVDRCVISMRGDSSGGAASGTQTWSQLTWSYTAECCQTALHAGATLISPPGAEPGTPAESYIAVPLETTLGRGFLALIASRPRLFQRELQSALRVIASRLADEVGWRSLHERTNDDLDRLSSGPGIDPLLGVWNQTALKQLVAMQIAAARRGSLPLAIVILDVIGLQAINTHHGLAVGDRVLRRIADAARTTLREEDIIGRWSGDELAVVLQGIGPESAQRVADRLHEALSVRPLELAHELLRIETSIGIAALQAHDDPVALLARAAHAAETAQRTGVASCQANPASHTSPRLSKQLEVVSEEGLSGLLGGTYRLLHEISRGGMGVVYRAQDRGLDRPVAIKMLRPDLAEDPDLVERFRIEASMLAHLQHPNLVQVYNFGHSGGESYFVMELVEGESLEQAYERHRAEGSAMSLLELPVVITQIASALEALHERGIIHRDVKPANVIRDPFRARSVLVDVGIARSYGQHTDSAGTPGFVAPEVFAEQRATVRSDVYGLAATAYTMLTLTRPWGNADHLAVFARQLGDELAPPSSIRPELAPVDAILVAALSKDPERRPASAGELARQLAEALATVAPPSVPEIRPRNLVREPVAEPPPSDQPRTRGVVFRSVSRALGIRESARLRDVIGGEHPELAHALHETAPLGWLASDVLLQLLTVATQHVGRERNSLARDIGRAAVRASFRRFFPASAATLVPERTLAAIRSVWGQYQSWGTIATMPVHGTEVVIKLVEPLRDPAMCAWTSGMLEQLVLLSGGAQPLVEHDTCEACGDSACLFRVTWERG